MIKLYVLSIAVLLCTPCSSVLAQKNNSSEAVIEWNQQILHIAEQEDGFMTLKGLRTVTMVHLAMHDALSSVEQTYGGYLGRKASIKANVFVAINQAAYLIAADQYPDKEKEFEKLYMKWVNSQDKNVLYDAGIQLGEDVAQQVLASRENDGWNAEASYTWHPMGPGVYAEFNEHSGTPEGFIFGAGWGEAVPFALGASDEFVSPAPPAIHSAAYARAFKEVKKLGAFDSPSRTDDQTHLAMWWKDFVENSHNRLARSLARKEQLPLAQTVRLFALLNMSVYDAYISSFYNKFLYNHWRPYTAIRWASNDGNHLTNEDERWTNTHQHTYAFPSYPSAHGTACAAATTVLANVFGDSYSYEMVTEYVDKAGPFFGKIKMNPASRSFLNFHEGALECAFSRVYLGIHFSYDSLEGFDLGRRVGQHVIDNFLTPHEQSDKY